MRYLLQAAWKCIGGSAIRLQGTGEDALEVRRLRSQMERGWSGVAGELAQAAARYDEAYARLRGGAR